MGTVRIADADWNVLDEVTLVQPGEYVEPSVCGGDEALCQLTPTLTTYYNFMCVCADCQIQDFN